MNNRIEIMDSELTKIINAAFIYESCPQRRRHADYRKELLTNRLNSYIEKKLSADKGGNGLEQSTDRREQVPAM